VIHVFPYVVIAARIDFSSFRSAYNREIHAPVTVDTGIPPMAGGGCSFADPVGLNGTKGGTTIPCGLIAIIADLAGFKRTIAACVERADAGRSRARPS
jgi:hypothetical protein